MRTWFSENAWWLAPVLLLVGVVLWFAMFYVLALLFGTPA